MRYIIFVFATFLLSCTGDEEKKETTAIFEKNVSSEENRSDLIADETIDKNDDGEKNADEGAIVVIPDDEEDITEDTNIESKEKMTRGREYRVYIGDKLIETSNAVVKIIKRTDRDYTSIYLVGGSATIYRSAE